MNKPPYEVLLIHNTAPTAGELKEAAIRAAHAEALFLMSMGETWTTAIHKAIAGMEDFASFEDVANRMNCQSKEVA